MRAGGLEEFDQGAEDGPLVQIHVGDAHDADARVEALDDLLDAQADQDQGADGAGERVAPIQPFGGGVQDLQGDPGLPQGPCDAGQPDGGSRTGAAQAAGNLEEGRTHQGDLGRGILPPPRPAQIWKV